MNIFGWLRDWIWPDWQTVTPVFHATGGAAIVLDALRGVIDPELNTDIVRLGLVRGIEVSAGRASVTLTLTTAGCPLGDWMVSQVEDAVRSAGFEPDVRIELEPPWSPDQREP